MADTIVVSQPQAAQVFGAAGAPRQRHVFMVRFKPVVPAGSNQLTSPLTFVVKHCDRPKVTIKSEELSQYNKKRQIYTGFKLDPIKITFYDSADGAAQNLWTAYCQHYFGDFDPVETLAETGYADDTISVNYNMGKKKRGFGLTGDGDTSNQWFFDHIEIFQFYFVGSGNAGMHKYDSYFLYNPRIISYEPDEMDYETSNVAQISMQIVYENLRYSGAKDFGTGSFDELTTGLFAGMPKTPPSSGIGSTGAGVPQTPVNPAATSLTPSGVAAVPDVAAPYRNFAANSTGPLAIGDFQFGSNAAGALATFNGAQADIASGNVTGILQSQFGSAGSDISQALLSTNSGLTTGLNGTVLSLPSYAAINSQQTGTAQYGFNDPNSLANTVLDI